MTKVWEVRSEKYLDRGSWICSNCAVTLVSFNFLPGNCKSDVFNALKKNIKTCPYCKNELVWEEIHE